MYEQEFDFLKNKNSKSLDRLREELFCMGQTKEEIDELLKQFM